MAQDLKKLFEEERKKKSFKMKEGHEDRFLNRLEEALPTDSEPNRYRWLQIAASIVVVMGIGAFLFVQLGNSDKSIKTTVVENPVAQQDANSISLGDLSPDLQKLEAYYTNNINLELASLEVSDTNRELVDSYLEQLAELNDEYQNLNKELNELGPNDQTITAQIKNLQLRLQLLQKLKTKLNQLKSSKNEQQSHTI